MNRNEKDVAFVIERYKSGMSINQIYKRYGYAFAWTRGVLVANGVPLRNSMGRAKKKELPEKEIKQIISLYEGGQTIAAIERKVGYSSGLIKRILNENNAQAPVEEPKRKPRKMSEIIPGEPIDCDTEGKRCIYRMNNGGFLCNYCSMVGHSRGGDPHECTKYKFKRK